MNSDESVDLVIETQMAERTDKTRFISPAPPKEESVMFHLPLSDWLEVGCTKQMPKTMRDN